MLKEKFNKLNIVDENKLEKYLIFCKENDEGFKKDNTEHHHILPKADSCFPEYKNLKENPWNGVHLTSENHYIAHSILAESIDEFSIISSWWGMNNKNYKSGKIKIGLDIIGPEKYSILKEKQRIMARDNEIGKVRCRDVDGNTLQVSKETFHKRDDLKHNTKGKVVCIDEQGTKIHVSKEEFDKRDDLSGHTLGKLPAILNGTGEKVYITKEEYKNNNHLYTHPNKGRNSGIKCHLACIIKIYNDKDELQFIFEGNFSKKTKELNLPGTAFGYSYRNNGTKLFMNLTKQHITKNEKKDWMKYKGWYAIRL